MKKLYITRYFFTAICIVGFFAFTSPLFAEIKPDGTAKIGDACTSSSQCVTGNCEDSFCVCDDKGASGGSAHCAARYFGQPSDWRCLDDSEDKRKYHGDHLQFCVHSSFPGGTYPSISDDKVKYPQDKKSFMGYACNSTANCITDNSDSLDSWCEETKFDSSNDPNSIYYDPWYTPGRKLKVCECGGENLTETSEICALQYGGTASDWPSTGESAVSVCRESTSPDLQGLLVCRKSNDWMPKTLLEMKSPHTLAANNPDTVNTTFLGFDISMEAPELVTPTTKIGIPGVFFTNITKATHITTDESGASWLNIPFLGEFISAIYKYSVGLISLIAVMVLIISGVQIITSAGNSEAISGAKHRIISSVIAIILTAGSYTILYTVNPDLVNLKNLKILVIEGKSLPVDSENVPEVIFNVGLDKIVALPGAHPNIPKNLPTKTNPIPYLIGDLPSSIQKCSASAFQYTAQKLAEQNVCLGSCHCGYTASHFLNYIGCDIVYQGGIPSLRKEAIKANWQEVKITKDNFDTLPVGLAIMTSGKNGTGSDIHAGISIGNGAIFDSSAKPLVFKKVNAATGNTCPPADPELGPIVFSIKDPTDNTQNCSGCSRIPSEAPASGRFASAYYTDPTAPLQEGQPKFLDSLIKGTNPQAGCKGIQVWAIRNSKAEIQEFNFVYVPPQLVQ